MDKKIADEKSNDNKGEGAGKRRRDNPRKKNAIINGNNEKEIENAKNFIWELYDKNTEDNKNVLNSMPIISFVLDALHMSVHSNQNLSKLIIKL